MEHKNGPTIMVVEDYDDTRIMIKGFLETRGYRLLEAVNGQEAVDLALREHPDLILMDLKMPVLNGIAATRLIREHEELRDVPIVVVSALDPELFRDAAFSVGATAFLPKPLDLIQLEGTLNNLLYKA